MWTNKQWWIFDKIVKDCEKSGVKFKAVNKKRVNVAGTKCSGYFSTDPNELAVAMLDKDGGFKTLIHEYCHMQQWKENCKAWTSCEIKDTDLDTETIIDLWLNHIIELSKEQLSKYIEVSRGVELDCEMRALKYIRKYELEKEVNPEEYAKAANAYLFFWSTLKKTRKWYDKKRPWEIPEILKEMPSKLLKNKEYEKVPKVFWRYYK